MGHLVNTTALRLGWFANWTDSWYTDYIYYPEFLFMVFRIRLYLISFFTLKQFERSAFFYSHFEILMKYNRVHVNVYLYDGATEGLMDNLFVDHYLEARRFNANPKHRKPSRYFDAWKILIVLNFMHKFSMYAWPLVRLQAVLRAFNLYSLRSLSYFLNHSKFALQTRASGARAYFFFVLFFNIRSIIARNFIKNRVSTTTILSRFIYVLAWGFWNKGLFVHLQTYLVFIFEMLTRLKKITVNFFALTGHSVNARFLSRFIARKLKQNYTVKELLNPIKRELSYVNFITKYPLSNYFYSLRKDEYDKVQIIEYRKGVYRYLLHF